jgi:hypothetical protein
MMKYVDIAIRKRELWGIHDGDLMRAYWRDAMRREIGHHHGMGIAARLRDQRTGNRAASAGAIIHHHRLAKPRCHAFCQKPGKDISRARGRERNHPTDLALRPSPLGVKRLGDQGGGDGRRHKASTGKAHSHSPAGYEISDPL